MRLLERGSTRTVQRARRARGPEALAILNLGISAQMSLKCEAKMEEEQKKGTVQLSQEAGCESARRGSAGVQCAGGAEEEVLTACWRKRGVLLRTLWGERSWTCCARANRIAEVEPTLITSLRKAHFQFPGPKSKHPAPLAAQTQADLCIWDRGSGWGLCTRQVSAKELEEAIPEEHGAQHCPDSGAEDQGRSV